MRLQKVGDQYVSMMFTNAAGKPTMVRVTSEEAILLGRGLLALFGIVNPHLLPGETWNAQVDIERMEDGKIDVDRPNEEE